MKYSIFALAAMATAVLAKPAFLNSAFELEEGKPFEIKYSGCEGGCTIVLQTGEPTHLSDVTTLTATAEGDSFTWTPSGLPSGTYSLKITNNDSKEENYSARFEYSGTGTLTVSSSSATATSAASSAASSASASASTTAGSSSAVSSAVTSSASTPALSSTASRNATIITTLTTASSKPADVTTKTTEAAKTTTGAATTTSATTVPDSGAARVGSSLALVAGAIMAMVYLN